MARVPGTALSNGTASPPTAALTSLRRPLWFPRSDSSGGGAKYSESGGLAIGLPPGATGGWRSVALDPMPVGAYELRLNVDVSGDRPISLRVAIETSDAPSAVPLAARQLVVWPADRHAVVTLPWTSDGAQSFAFSVTAGVDSGSARLRIDAIDLVRVWSTVAGSPRFVEPSLAGRAEE